MPESPPTPDRSTHKSVLHTHRTVILGRDDRPLGWPRLFFSAKQTMTLLALGRVEISKDDKAWWSDDLELSEDDKRWWSDDYIMGVTKAYRLPAMVRVREASQSMFSGHAAAFNQFNLFLRDEGQCQYEDVPVLWKHPEKDWRATMDHVIPASEKGRTYWDNILLASHKANNEKRNRTPQQWGREPIHWPFIPTNGEILYYSLKSVSLKGLSSTVVELFNTVKPTSYLIDKRQAGPLNLQPIAA